MLLDVYHFSVVNLIIGLSGLSYRSEEATDNVLLHPEYRKISNIRRNKSQNLNVSRLGSKLSLCNILKPSVK